MTRSSAIRSLVIGWLAHRSAARLYRMWWLARGGLAAID